METKEYYTPKISDLFVGYECEVLKTKCKTTYNTVKEALDKNESIYKCTNYWESTTLSCIQSVGILATNIENIRAHYLCKQDIIDFGFKEVSHKHPFLGNIEGYEKHLKTEGFNELSLYRIVKHPKSEIIEIHRIYESSWGSQHEQLFSGLCKSKNEFIKLIKDYLNIPI